MRLMKVSILVNIVAGVLLIVLLLSAYRELAELARALQQVAPSMQGVISG